VKILNAAEIRLWDQYTIDHEPIASINLMERAATACVEWIKEKELASHSFTIFCGKGNNGGDGLAIARMLTELYCTVQVYILEFGHKGTDDFQVNLERIHQSRIDVRFIQSEEQFHQFHPGEIIIDALFGSGLNRPLDGITAKLVDHINHSGCRIISIDIPSGLSADQSSKGNIAIKANDTLSFQCYKPAFLVAENSLYTGNIHILEIGLLADYYNTVTTDTELTDEAVIRTIYKPRNNFSHKGNFGHALLIAGSYGKMGAAVLSAKACLKSGAGLLTTHIPKSGYDIMQTSLPEAMVVTDFNSSFNTKAEDDLLKYDAIGIGPGLGTASETKTFLRAIYDSYRKPMVIDADALNSMASQKDLLKLIPPGSILTPHPKEFERLFGSSENDFDRIQLASEKAKELRCIIVLKCHHSFIASPDTKGFFNNTGNAGMATAGSGDVLTGILTSLIAQGYSSMEAAILGVYIHGVAGDYAARQESMEAMIAGDIINNLGKAFSELSSPV
jgi:ADP-dependent NAD(P)H-hydrate dehydratase / NAD(P)H-hydrate epimerase